MKAVSKDKRSSDALSLAQTLAAEPAALAAAFPKLSLAGTEKFRIAKSLLLLSEQQPATLYPHFLLFQALLNSENNILKWTAFRIIANLATVDVQGRIPSILDSYLKPISGSAMITAAHAIVGGAKIASAQKSLTDNVVEAILKVEKARYQTAECRNIVIGHAITALAAMGETVVDRPDVLGFLRRQTKNSRNATRRKAEKLLKTATHPVGRVPLPGALQRDRSE